MLMAYELQSTQLTFLYCFEPYFKILFNRYLIFYKYFNIEFVLIVFKLIQIILYRLKANTRYII